MAIVPVCGMTVDEKTAPAGSAEKDWLQRLARAATAKA